MRPLLFPLFLTTLHAAGQWTPMATGTLSNRSLCVVNGDVYLASYPNGVFKSADGTGPFTAVNSGLQAVGGQYPVQSVGADATYVYAGTEVGVFRSPIGADSWSNVNGTLTANANVHANKFFAFGGAIMAVFNGSIAQGGGIHRSVNGGTTWLIGHSGMGSNVTVHHLTEVDGTLWASTSTGLWTSLDNAQSWTPHPVVNYATYALARQNNSLVIVSSFGIRYSTNNGASWQDATGDPAAPTKGELVAFDGALYAIVGGQNGCLRSTNNGATWTAFVDGMSLVDASAQEEFHATPEQLYCSALFDVYTIAGTGVGIVAGSSRSAFDVWPALAENELFARTDAPGSLLIHNAAGQLLRSTKLAAGLITRIPCDDLTPGLLLVSFVTGDGQRHACRRVMHP